MPVYHFALETEAGLVDIGSLDLPSRRAELPAGLKLTMEILAKMAETKSDGAGYTVQVTDDTGMTVLHFRVPAPDEEEKPVGLLH